MAKKLSKAEAAAAAAAQLEEIADWTGWLKKTRRSAKKSKVKDTDTRFFCVLSIDEGQCITWKKDDDPAKVAQGDHFHKVSEIVLVCGTDGGNSFALQLGADCRSKKKGDVAGENVEIAASEDETELYELFKVLVAGGAQIEGGASTEVTELRKPLTILQESNTAVEFSLDDDNCLKDFKGSVLKVKGVAMGMKLCTINDMDVKGWPRWCAELRLADPTTETPVTCYFYPCSATQQVIDESVEHCIGKKAIVAGCSAAGIAIANLLAAEGADVAIIDTDSGAATDKLIEDQFHTVGQMEFAKRLIKGYDADVSNEAAVADAVDAVLSDFGQIDILVNAFITGAELNVSGATQAVDFLEDFDKHFGKNVGAAIVVTKAVISKAMVPAKAGCVISVTYPTGREVGGLAEATPMSFGFAYSMQALETMTRCWAAENEDTGIRCNILIAGRMEGDELPAPDMLVTIEPPSHFKQALLIALDTDSLNGELIDAPSESRR